MKKIIGLLSVFVFFFACKNTPLPQKYNKQIQTLDTDFSKGQLGEIHHLELEDLQKFHGHLCDGLVVGYQALEAALAVLYPDGTIDRTNTRIVSKSSPCLTDAAIYLTGARYQFNTFYVANDIEGLFVVQRIDNRKAVVVNLKKGVKPPAIDSLGNLALKGALDGCELNELKVMEADFSNFLLKTAPTENYIVHEITNFEWTPVLKNDFVKTDILNKNKSKCSH